MTRAGLAASVAIILAGGAGLASAAVSAPTSFAGRADAACAATGAKIVALPAPTKTTVVPNTRSTETLVTKLVSELRAIKAPAKKAKGYAAFIASTKEQATILAETLTAYNANQIQMLIKLQDDGATVGDRANAEAKALGLPACAKNYTPSAMAPTTPTTPTTPASPYSAAPAAIPAPAAAPAPAETTPAATGSPSGAGASAGSSASSTNSAGSSSQSGTQDSNGSSTGGQTVTGILTSG